jgi:5-methylcytosine-specific restriction endonuclease McrA
MVTGGSIKQSEKTTALRNEVNLGPLPREIVGEEVLFLYEGGTFGLCLDTEYVNQDYLRTMAKRYRFGSIDIKFDNLSAGADVPDTVDSGDILLAESLFSPHPDGPIVDSANKYLAEISPGKNEEWSCIGVVRGDIVQDEFKVPVIVTDIHSRYIEVKGALPESKYKLPDVGETVRTTTGQQYEMGTLALYEGEYTIPVVLKSVDYPDGKTLDIKITGIKDSFLIGEAAFSADDFDVIHISNDEITEERRRSRNRVVKQGVPIDIEPVPTDATTTNRVIVTDESSDALIGRWNIQREIGPIDITEGDDIDLEIRSVDGDSCIGYYEQLPVRVEFNTAIPSEFEKECLSVSIRAVHPDKAIAEPRWIEEPQGALEVRVVGTTADSAIAIRENRPVRIPNPSVVESSDWIVVGISESKSNNIVNATVSARPVFQNTEGPHLIRLPRTQGDIVQVSGSPAVVDHLPDVDSAVTLGVAEVNEDHIVPTVTALPEAHLPDEGSHILTAPEKTVDNMVVGVGEELPLKLQPFLPTVDDTIMARVLELRSGSLFGVVGGVGDDTSDRLQQAYGHLRLAVLTLQQGKYQDATEHVSEASQSCPSEFPVFNRLSAIHEMVIQAILSIHNNSEFGETAHVLSQEANRLREFENEGRNTAEIDAFLSAREAEMRAAEQLLIALDEVDHDITSDLQMIAQGVSAKAPVVKAAEHLSTAEEFVVGTPFEDQIPSLGIRVVIREFEEAFPGIVDELQPFDPPKDDADWLRYLVPEWIIDRTDQTISNTETDGNTWRRPAVPETTGIVSMTETSDNDDTSIKYSITTENTFGPEEVPIPKGSNSPDSGISESRQTEVDGPQDTATDEESQSAESGQTPSDTEEETPEQVATTEASSNELNAENTTDGQSSATEDTSESETETIPAVETSSSTTGSETTQSETPDEPLSVPDGSPKLRELREKAEAEASENPEREHVEMTVSRYRRSSAIRNYALKRADGTCEVCGEEAPFVKENGDPYLEVHHVNELGEGGADHPSLVGAVCPNCHRKIHYGKHGDVPNERLRRRLEQGLGDVGAVDE